MSAFYIYVSEQKRNDGRERLADWFYHRRKIPVKQVLSQFAGTKGEAHGCEFDGIFDPR